jgi:hypothetical protein
MLKPKPSKARCRRACPEGSRRDGWTPERQLRFLDALVATRSVGRAAAATNMSREGAYRLRNRCEGTLFALLWDRALTPGPIRLEVHNQALTDGRIMRLLGDHYRRESGDFRSIAPASPKAGES